MWSTPNPDLGWWKSVHKSSEQWRWRNLDQNKCSMNVHIGLKSETYEKHVATTTSKVLMSSSDLESLSNSTNFGRCDSHSIGIPAVFAVILYWPQTLTKSKATHINPTQQECMAFPAREHCALCEMDSTFTLLVRIAAAACSVTGIPCNNKSSTPWANLLDLTMYSRLHPLVSAGTSKLPLRGRWLAFWYRSAIPRPESPYFSKYSSRPWKMLKVIGVYQSPCYISLCLHKNNPIKNNAT